MPVGAAARGPRVSPGRGPIALGRAMLVMLVLALSTLWACRVVPLLEPRPQRDVQWVWGSAGQAQAEPPLLSHRKRDDGGQQPSATVTAPEHGLAATVTPSSNETDPLESNPLLGSVAPAAPGANTSLPQALVVSTAADLWDETDSPDPDLLLSSVPPASPSTDTSPLRALVVSTAADLLDETDSPAPDLLLSSAPSAPPGTSASPLRARVVSTAADPLDETDTPDPDLLLNSVLPAEPSTQPAPQKSITTIPSQLTSLSEEETVAGGTDSSLVTPGATTTGYKEVKKAKATPAPTHPALWDTKPWGTTMPRPWDLSRVMSKCLLAILLLALVAATFLVCTGVLGALLWRRARTARRRLSPTEMICISSLLPDGEGATNGPRPGPARRQKLLLDGGFEADGDNLTLSSFLPEHS